jgi:hypothetical protein
MGRSPIVGRDHAAPGLLRVLDYTMNTPRALQLAADFRSGFAAQFLLCFSGTLRLWSTAVALG